MPERKQQTAELLIHSVKQLIIKAQAKGMGNSAHNGTAGMDVTANIRSKDLPDSVVQKLAREFAKRANKIESIDAQIPEETLSNEDKGATVTIGAVLLAVLSSSAVAELIKLMRNFANRDSSIEFELISKKGEKFRISGSDLTLDDINKILEKANSIMEFQDR